MRFEKIKPPARSTPLTELEVEGRCLDLHRKLDFIGMTWGTDETALTLGWAALSEVLIVQQGQALPLGGLALSFTGLQRFEASFQQGRPGELEYFEFRQDPEPTLIFFFAAGTLRLSAEVCRGDLLIEADEEESGSNPSESVQ